MRLSYNEIMNILDLKYIPTKKTGYSLDPGIYEVIDLNNTLKHILPNNVKVNTCIYYTILGFTQSRSYPLDDIDGFYQLIAGSYKSDKPVNITRVDKIHSRLCWSKTLIWYKNITGEITVNRKTGKQIKLLVGKCVICDRRKSMIVSDNTIHAEGLGDFFENLGKISAKAGKKLAKNVISNPGRAYLTAKIATAAATKSPKTALSTLPEVITFYHTGKGFFLGKSLYNYSYK